MAVGGNLDRTSEGGGRSVATALNFKLKSPRGEARLAFACQCKETDFEEAAARGGENDVDMGYDFAIYAISSQQ
jgi:hypothetical protein